MLGVWPMAMKTPTRLAVRLLVAARIAVALWAGNKNPTTQLAYMFKRWN